MGEGDDFTYMIYLSLFRAHSEASGAISFSSVTASPGDSTINNQVIGNKVFSSSVADSNINVGDDIVSKLSDINSDPTLSGTDVNTTNEFSDDVSASVLADTAENETFIDSPASEGFQSAFDSVETSEFLTNLKEIPFTELGKNVSLGVPMKFFMKFLNISRS